jgi:hypothetical protein
VRSTASSLDRVRFEIQVRCRRSMQRPATHMRAFLVPVRGYRRRFLTEGQDEGLATAWSWPQFRSRIEPKVPCAFGRRAGVQWAMNSGLTG